MKPNMYKFKCAPNRASDRIVYMIYPDVDPFGDQWLNKQADELGVSVAIIFVPFDKWNDDLTPWPAPPETPSAEPFSGRASEFYDTLVGSIIPEIETEYKLSDIRRRDLVGVSLSGLFTLWQWMIHDEFHSIASLSGSFWYDGFIEWFEKQPFPSKSGKAFFLLGSQEPKARIKAYRTVGVNTEAIVRRINDEGIAVQFEWVAGGHMSDPVQRAERALREL